VAHRARRLELVGRTRVAVARAVLGGVARASGLSTHSTRWVRCDENRASNAVAYDWFRALTLIGRAVVVLAVAHLGRITHVCRRVAHC
jgi:hypothetical protein